jgi:hypothetical protein
MYEITSKYLSIVVADDEIFDPLLTLPAFQGSDLLQQDAGRSLDQFCLNGSAAIGAGKSAASAAMSRRV